MKRLHPKIALIALATSALVTLAPQGRADGTEVLGAPVNLVVQQGSVVRSVAVSLAKSSGNLAIDLPTIPMTQAILYWEAQASAANMLGESDVLLIDGQLATGELIGGPTLVSSRNAPSMWTASYRSDVTNQVQLAPGSNNVSVKTADADKKRAGAGLLVILGDGAEAGETLVLDGNDFAFPGAAGSLAATTPVSFDFAPAVFARPSRLQFLVATSDPMAPSVILAQFPGEQVQVFVDVITITGSSDSTGSMGLIGAASGLRGGGNSPAPGISAVQLPLWVPVGADSLTVQVLSLNSGEGPFAVNSEAELRWLSASFNIPAVGGDNEGCTPGYWKQPQHFDSWPAPYTPSDLFVDVFGVDAFPGFTLLDALQQGGGGLNALGRHVVAALLNAASPGVDYPMDPDEVIQSFQWVFNTAPTMAQVVKDRLANHNEAGCPLN